jgi:diguanylate cyclase (GGDEF)-like protein
MELPVLGIIPEFRLSLTSKAAGQLWRGKNVLNPASAKSEGKSIASCPTLPRLSTAQGPKAAVFPSVESLLPDQCVIKAFSELSRETVDRRWEAVNVLVRVSMLAGLKLELEQALNLVCDLAGEIVPHIACAAFFWKEEQKQLCLSLARHLAALVPEAIERSNLVNDWTRVYQGPVLIPCGSHPEADRLLAEVGAQSLLAVPLFVDSRVLGALQFFGAAADSFTEEDARFLWMLSLLSDKLFPREYANEALVELAFTDFLTGLKTRRYFEEQLDREIKRAARNGSPLSLILIDVDHFKLINDRYGHQTGDLVLREIASRLVKGRREIDTVARYGGEEFIIILPDTNLVGADHLAQRLREEIETTGFAVSSSSNPVRLTISLGVASFPRDGQSKPDLLEAADVALYEAKDSGRNRVVLRSEIDIRQGMRREQRLSVALPVRVWGMDINGELFEHEAMTVDLTTTGARLEGITGLLQKGCVVGVQHAISKARYRVTWVGAEGTLVQNQIGLQLIDSGKLIWGRVIPRIFGDDFRRGRIRNGSEICQLDSSSTVAISDKLNSDAAAPSAKKSSLPYRCSGSIVFHEAGGEFTHHATGNDIDKGDGDVELFPLDLGTEVSISLNLDDVFKASRTTPDVTLRGTDGGWRPKEMSGGQASVTRTSNARSTQKTNP